MVTIFGTATILAFFVSIVNSSFPCAGVQLNRKITENGNLCFNSSVDVHFNRAIAVVSCVHLTRYTRLSTTPSLAGLIEGRININEVRIRAPVGGVVGNRIGPNHLHLGVALGGDIFHQIDSVMVYQDISSSSNVSTKLFVNSTLDQFESMCQRDSMITWDSNIPKNCSFDLLINDSDTLVLRPSNILWPLNPVQLSDLVGDVIFSSPFPIASRISALMVHHNLTTSSECSTESLSVMPDLVVNFENPHNPSRLVLAPHDYISKTCVPRIRDYPGGEGWTHFNPLALGDILNLRFTRSTLYMCDP